MAPTCGTPVFDIFWECFIRNNVKMRRKSVKNAATDRKFKLLFVYNPNRMSTFFFTFLFTCPNITTVGQNVKKLFAPTNGKQRVSS